MNEQITVAFGADLTGISSGLRSLNRMVHDSKKDIDNLGESLGNSLKSFGHGALAFAGVGVSVGALVEGAKEVTEYAKHITILSDEVGVSTKTLQQFEYAARKTGASTEAADKTLQKLAETVGKAKSGEDAQVKVLERWGIAIYDANGQSRSMDEILDSVAEKMRSATDPTIQNAMAMELGGKSAKNLVEALKNLDEYKAKAENKILSESELATLENAEKTVKSIGGSIKNFATHAFAALLSPLFNNDAEAMKKSLERFDQRNADKQKPTEAQIKYAKEMAKALDELHKAQAGGEVMDKWLSQRLKVAELQKEYDAAQEGSVDKIKKETELTKAQNELRKIETEDQRKADKEKADTDKANHASQIAAEQELQKEKEQTKLKAHAIHQAELEVTKAKRSQKEALQDQSKFSLQELAERGNAFGRRASFSERTAADIQYIENDVKLARDYGNTDYADRQQNRANDLRKSIGFAINQGESDPMRQYAEAVTKSEEHLKWIKEKGISVKAFDDIPDT